MLRDKLIRHAHFVERYKTQQANNIIPFLKRAEDDLKKLLLKTDNIYSRKILKEKLTSVNKIMAAHLSGFIDLFESEIDKFIEAESGFTARAIGNGVIPTFERARAAVYARPFNSRFLRDELTDFVATQAKFIRDTVAMGFFESKTTAEIVKDLIGTNALDNKDGAFNLTKTKASRMTRTALNHVQSVTNEQTYLTNDFEYYEIIATLDSRTSLTCASLSGNIYPVGKGLLPPFHPNCRTITVALTSDEYELKDGKPVKITDDLTYPEWLKNQSPEFQNEALGVERAKLFRNGELTIKQFVDRKNMPLTLAELKQKYSISDPEG